MNTTPKKLLYVSPHLSTGGQPQFVLKQIEEFKDEFEIQVVEVNNSGGNAFVVQKNKIKDLVPLYTLYEDKSEILKVIDDFQPDIIHFHEVPEHFLDTKILDKIWDNNRKYYIISTTHGSFTDPTQISYQPDRYVLVSKWSKQKFDDAKLGVETLIWEYPVDEIEYDKEQAKIDLGFEPDWKHVLNVGLFTPGKNQKEIFEIAKELERYKIKFHFVGNQAGNFQDYWKPLMDSKPSNCIVWGERNDVDRFYKAADLFYFSTLWELNPLSVKEALSHKLPCIFRRLHTYLDTYDNNPLVTYINSNTTKTKHILLDILKPETIENMIYDNLIKNTNNIVEIPNKVSINFVRGAFVEISGNKEAEYKVEFINNSTGRLMYSTTIKNNCWCKCSYEYNIDWKILVYEDGQLFTEHIFNPENKRVFISFESKAFGDTLAWIPYVDEFRKKWNCNVITSTFMNELFEENYPEIEFVKPGTNVTDLYAMYSIGLFYNQDGGINYQKNPNNFREQPMQKIATDILGLEYFEVKPKLHTMYQKVQKYRTNTHQWLQNLSDEIFNQKEYVYKEISVQPNDVVLDLGGNIGLFAAYSVSKGAKKVYSVEPYQPYVEMMDDNLKSLKRQVQIIPYAISDKNGVSNILVNFDENTILTDVYDDYKWNTDDRPKYEIKTIDFDTLLSKYDITTINYLKVDIEGSEYNLFKSIDDKILKTRIEKIAIEYHWSYNREVDDIINKLENCGFVVYSFETNSTNKCGKVYAYNPDIYKLKKQVSIAIHGTTQAKYWNNSDGWQSIVDWLKEKGYDVVLLSREGDGYMGNKHPKGVRQLTPGPIQKVIDELQKSELFIGIGSGLSWLSWATGTKTMLISGFSYDWAEMQDCIRITPPTGKCEGCFNRFRLDAGDWNWCPDHKGSDRQFECTKSITPEIVIKELEKIL